MNLKQFGTKMRDRAKKLEDNANKLTQKTALAVDQALVFAMPVDTGRARSSVVVSLATPVDQIMQARYPGKKGSTAGQNAQASIQQAESIVSARQLGDPIYINISLAYIGRLNEGYSPQAPPGFIQKAISSALEFDKNQRLIEN